MLFINAVWDIISSICIWCSFCVKDVLDQVNTTTSENDCNTSIGEENSTPLLELNNNGKLEGKRQGHFSPAGISFFIAEMHTGLWTRKGDASNHAACMLMSWLVLTLGMIRLYACFSPSFVSLAAVSYAIEGIFFLSEALKSTMIPKRTSLASIFCFVCLLVCVVEIPQQDSI